MVQLCLMQHAYDKSMIRVVSCKSNLQLACDCRVRHKECRELLRHVLTPYDNLSHKQFGRVKIVSNFFYASSTRYKNRMPQSQAKIVLCKSALSIISVKLHLKIVSILFLDIESFYYLIY